MRKPIYILLFVLGHLAFVNDIYGAAITMADLPYLCDFENDTENANWVLNPAIDQISTTNRWIIGEATAYTGRKSLYVSHDGGLTNTYAATNNVLLAYRDITLEAGDYDIAYDWCGLGNKTKGYLKIVYANRPTSGLKCLGNSVEPDWVSSSVQLMGNNTSLNDGDAWRHVQARVSIPVAQANKTTTRLLFVWVNTDVTKKDSLTTVAIDNLQLAKASPNDYPTNIHVTTSLGTSVVSWEGQAEEYEVMYRKKTDDEFETLPVTGNTVTLSDVEYGAYEFWICGKNGEDKTVYTVFPTVYLYETDCFDALNMYNAEFEYGKWQHRTGKEIKGTDRVDYGPQDVRSRHTTHFDLTEVDPRTVIKQGNDTVACLKTVPTGEFGSVRLGNWNTGSEYESMTFHYTVESQSMAVLLIHYAMVLENPDHGADEQPRFTLDVLDEEGNPIDTKCASVDFHAPTSQEWQDPEVQAIWHQLTWSDPKGSNNNSHLINWQEWKTIGVSMENYVGQTLTIKLTSYDCDQGGHFGYAYFMLNCSRSDVDGVPWGEGSTTRMFTAPEGFDYAWFNRTDLQFKDTLSQDRFFYVQEADTNTYLCHVTYPTNAECGYWFDASAKPHNTKAELDWRWEPKNCVNGYRWWNKCHVVLINQQNGEIEHRYDKQLEKCYLITEDGTDMPIGYDEDGVYTTVPDEGGLVRFGVWTGIYVNQKLYADTAWYEFEIPSIGPIETHLYDSVCRGESVVFPEGSHDKYSDTGVYADSLTSAITGCDSVVLFHLQVHEPREVTVYDTICIGSTYTFGGRVISAPGVYTGLFMSRETGCDSVVTLRLFQASTPRVSLREHQLCADQPLLFAVENALFADSMQIRVNGDVVLSEWLHSESEEVALQLSNNDVGVHQAVVQFYMPWCETAWTDTLQYGISLASNLIELHWTDMLSFLSPDYNGGLTFLSYQWYQDGVAIEGATQSYYYDPDMNMDTEYSVRVTMADGSEAWVCPFTPAEVARTQGIENADGERKARKILREGQLRIICNGVEYDARGFVLTERQPRDN